MIPGDFEVLCASGETNWGEGFGVALYDVNTPLGVANDWLSWDNDWNSGMILHTDTINWHHLAITADDQYNAVLYRDNVIRNYSNITNKNIIPEIAFDYVVGHSYRGELDDIRIYKRTLTAVEIELISCRNPLVK